MITMKKSFRIIFQITMIIFFAIILIIQGSIIISVNSLIASTNRESGENILKNIVYEMTDKINMADKISDLLAKKRSIQNYISETDERKRKLAFKEAFDKIWDVVQYTGENMYILAWDNQGDKKEIVNTLEDRDTKFVDQFFENHITSTQRNNIYIDATEDAILICKIQDVDMYDLSKVGMDNIGKVGVIIKLNKYMLQRKMNLKRDISIELVCDNNESIQLFASDDEGKRQNVQTMNIDDTSYSIVCSVQSNRMPEQYRNIRNLVLLIAGVCILFFIIFMVLFRTMFSRAINRIFTYLDDYPYNKKIKALECVGITEFDVLIHHINNMLTLIDKTNHKVFETQQILYEKEIEKKNTLFYMYQLQIQPHFLYNTLGCINSYAIENNVWEIVEITSAMADMFRYSLEYPDKVCFEKELEYAQSYINIQKLRYPKLVRFRIDVDEDLFGVEVPKMILQPIVENAFKHGILPKKEKSVICISARIEGSEFVITVSDDGVGMSAEKLEEVRNNIYTEQNKRETWGSIGMANVHKRIKLMYGNDYGVTISSEEGKGCSVVMTVPVQYGEVIDDTEV